jgi:hypothetical protein
MFAGQIGTHVAATQVFVAVHVLPLLTTVVVMVSVPPMKLLPVSVYVNEI